MMSGGYVCVLYLIFIYSFILSALPHCFVHLSVYVCFMWFHFDSNRRIEWNANALLLIKSVSIYFNNKVNCIFVCKMPKHIDVRIPYSFAICIFALNFIFIASQMHNIFRCDGDCIVCATQPTILIIDIRICVFAVFHMIHITGGCLVNIKQENLLSISFEYGMNSNSNQIKNAWWLNNFEPKYSQKFHFIIRCGCFTWHKNIAWQNVYANSFQRFAFLNDFTIKIIVLTKKKHTQTNWIVFDEEKNEVAKCDSNRNKKPNNHNNKKCDNVHWILQSYYKKRRQINVYLKDWSVIRKECEKKWKQKTEIVVKKNTIGCVNSSSSSSFYKYRSTFYVIAQDHIGK